MTSVNKFALSTSAFVLGVVGVAHAAHAQSTTPNLVSACSGVSLPRSVVTDIMRPVIGGVADPTQNTVNSLLGVLGALPGVPTLNIDTTTLLNQAAAGDPITLQTLAADGTLVGPADRCDVQGDSYSLNTQGGISIGGNRITGLGVNGEDASAGSNDSIAFGNFASTDATATNSMAFGTGASVGANAVGGMALGGGADVTAANSVALGTDSAATRGALANYAAFGLAAAQNSAGEVSVGAPGAERQITNVAAGSSPTDAVNVAQLQGVAAQVGDVADTAVLYDSATKDRVTLAGTGGTTITNVAPGTLAAGSSDAVNGSQLYATNGNVTNNRTAITNLTNSIQNGAVGPVRYSNPGTPSTPNGGTPTNDVALVGANAGPVAVHNVADGALGAGSTDAVNGGQLAALGATTAGAIGGGTTYDPTSNQLSTSLDYGGTTYSSIQAALNAIGGAVNGGSGNQYFRVQSNGGPAMVSADDSMAIGPDANATAANSVALGSGAVASRGGQAGYNATGVALPQTSVGEVSVGAAGATRQITHVAAGSAPTDAVNVAQLNGVADQVASLGSSSVQYDDTSHGTVTLDGAGGTTITNVKAGSLAAGSTDAVNGSQLHATNVNVANNTTAISNLSNSVSNGSTGPVQYSDPADPTTPNGGTKTDDLTLVGADSGAVSLHNVGNGSITRGSTDAINGGQIYGLALTAVNAVSYDSDADGNRTNTVTLTGGDASQPVAIHNVARGSVAQGSTDAVNGGQLYDTNQAVASAQTTADDALALGQNSVQYDDSTHTSVTLGDTSADGASSEPVTVHNVAAGTSANDAVNVQQLNAGLNNTLAQANAYTDQQLATINYDIKDVRRDGYAGTAGALAAAGLPQAYEPGKGMIALAGGTYGGESAVALGFSRAMNDEHTVVKFSGMYDSRGRAGASAGIGYQF